MRLFEALENGRRNALEMVDYVRTLTSVRADRAAHELRRKITRGAIAAAAALAVGTALVISSYRIVAGLAGAFTALFEGRAWAGDLAAGLVVLGLIAAAIAVAVRRSEKKELEEHLQKYESKHEEHRQRHGHHLADLGPPP